MARNAVEKATSIDVQLQLLAPRKLSEDDKLVEYDARLLDRFLDILQDLHGEDIRETLSRNRFMCAACTNCLGIGIGIGFFFWDIFGVLTAANGVVIPTEKKLPSILVDETSVQKIQALTPNIGVVYSGMGPDFRVLVRKSRKQAQQYYRLYKVLKLELSVDDHRQAFKYSTIKVLILVSMCKNNIDLDSTIVRCKMEAILKLKEEYIL